VAKRRSSQLLLDLETIPEETLTFRAKVAEAQAPDLRIFPGADWLSAMESELTSRRSGA
jgi:hypothetical protein